MNETPQNIQVKTESVQNIADSIRAKNHSNQKYKIGEMSGAIDDMKVAIPNTMLTIESNGVYDVSTDEKVSVEVPLPSGSVTLTSNGTHDVTQYASADVQVPEPTGTIGIGTNGTFNVKDYEFADVNTPTPSGSITLTSNGTHTVTNYVQAIVNVPSAVPVPSFCKFNPSIQATGYTFDQTQWTTYLSSLDFTNCTNAEYMLANFTQIEYIPILQNIKPTSCKNMFSYDTSLKRVELFDTSLCINFKQMFKSCTSLETVPKFDMSSNYSTNYEEMFTVNSYSSGSAIALTDTSLDNIMQSLLTITSYISPSSKKLTKAIYNLDTWLNGDGGTTRTRIQNLPSYTAFTNGGWSIS